MAAGALCARLADLALLTPAPSDGGTVTMHDVIRDYLREELGAARLAQLHQILLDTAAEDLPAPPPAAGTGTVHRVVGAARAGTVPAGAPDRAHARRRADRRGRGGRRRPAVGRCPAASSRARPGRHADLALIGTPRAERLRRVLGQAAHLLAPTDPPHSLTDILYSRVSHDPDWGPQAHALPASRTQPALINTVAPA